MTTNERPEQAFPSTFKSLDEETHIHAWGMSLRDYFAIRVMQALVSHEDLKGTKEDYCAMAYKAADAMLKARDQ